MPTLVDYLTVKEAARKRNVSRQAILFSMHEGRLPFTQIGRDYLILAKDLAAWKPMKPGPKKSENNSGIRR